MSPDAPRSRHFPFSKLLFALLAAAILVGAAGTGALLAYNGRYSDRVYPGVTVDGIDLAGLDRAGARTALQAGLARYGQGAVTVTAGAQTVTIPFSAANRRVDIDALLDQAFAVGRTGDSIARATTGVSALFSTTVLHPTILVDQAPLAAAVEQAAATVDAGMVDATAAVTPGGFTTTAAIPGRGLDRPALVAAILTALADPAAPATLAVTGRMTAVAPEITDAEVASAVATAQAMARDVVLAAGNNTWSIPAATVRTWITFSRDASGAYVPAIADDSALAAVQALATKVNQKPVEASFVFRATSVKPSVTPGHDGITLDVATTAQNVVAAIRARATSTAPVTPPAVPLAATVVQPTLSTAAAVAAASKVRKISTWTTYYPVGAHNGFGANITIPAREINGTVVAPGATFDWWVALAPVNVASLLARGYKYGGAIINGHSAEGKAIAGGICSASTTLFNAVARAGYRIDERYNHYYFINRYPTGMDATVAAGAKNLRWTNDTKYPVLIRGSGTPGVVTFSLYTVAVNDRKVVGGGSLQPGRPNLTYRVANGRTVTISSSGLGNYQSPGSPITQITHNPRENGTVIDYPLPGFNITVWRTVMENGKVVDKDKWYSNYTMMRLLTLVYKK